jgi:hypothetical protein
VAYSHTVVGGHTYNAFTTGKPSSTKWYLQGNLNFDRL